jgi:putative hydrolase of the HAD superfamily
MGGTLDGAGHWLDRFVTLYHEFGTDLPREKIREAFDDAERRSSTDERIASANFKQMVEFHVDWQLARLGLTGKIREHLIKNFVAPAMESAAENKQMLARLRDLDFELGIVSNGCGNVATLCEDFGYAPFLSVIVDSRRVGLFKPDPAIFLHAAQALGCETENTLMVGDSLDRDMQPAKSIGMKTAWLNHSKPNENGLADVQLQQLRELPEILSKKFAVA